MSESIGTVISYLAAIGFGGIVASVVSHRFTAGREVRAKRDDFRGFLGRWKGQLLQVDRSRTEKIGDVCRENFIHLHGYGAKIGMDFGWRRKKFRKLCMDLANAATGDFYHTEYADCRDDVLHKIQALIDFV